MSKVKSSRQSEMLPEYDFTNGVRGKHARQFKRGHSVKIRKIDGSVEVESFGEAKKAHSVSGPRRSKSGRKEKVVTDKYRGTTIYAHVLAELIRAAQYQGLTTYQDIAVIMGLPTDGNKMGKETGHCVGEISEDEVLAGRPMLSVLVVKSRGGKPGPGFFSFAQKLGRMKPGEDEQEFWQQERAAVYAAWRRPLRK